MNAAGIARRLGAVRQGHNWRTPCLLGCGYTLSIAEGDDERLLLHCHGGCKYDAILPALVEYGLLDDEGDRDPGDHDHIDHHRRDNKQRSEIARWIYDHLVPAIGTVVESYLRSRGITIAVPQALRFGNCPHRTGGTYPAMAAPVVDIDGKLIGVHLTYLRDDGAGKADFPNRDLQRECRGVIRGGAIRLAAHNPDRELIVAEGVESTMAAMELLGLPGWSAVSAGGLKILELPPVVRNVCIAADNDTSGAGQRNALAAFERWSREGRRVRIKIPPNAGDDFNDVIRRGRQ
jgi:hypothetical protein